ncbi:MAG: exodeoxyribonuclease VII large subunit [Rhodocyclaceae bacterium]|nr:exodeoxyribonuclease VII large subunit [Rhodocyclaceae bacterium]
MEGPGSLDPATPVTVSDLNRMARQALERQIPLLWITGEVSNLVRAASGHIYFTLKDNQAQVRCTMWRNRAQLLPFRLANGQQIEIRALATLYEARGDFQLNVEAIRQAGVGSLFEAFLRLRDQLQAEGLFDPALRRPLPRYPRAIGIVTSPQAAALKDVIAAVGRRAPGIPLVLYPAPVQGEGAAAQLTMALQAASQRADGDAIDLILLVRGGGSLEDLWAFNDAALARAIRASAVPVVSGVGHESDVSISDLAADLRAATPTAAAELATQGYVDLALRLSGLGQSLDRAIDRRLGSAAQRLDRAAVRLIHPADRLARTRERLDHLAHRLDGAMQQQLEDRRHRGEQLAWRLEARRPRLDLAREALRQWQQRLHAAADQNARSARRTLDRLESALGHLGPLGVLARGYSIVRDSAGHVLTDPTEAPLGSQIRVTLAKGGLEAAVTRHGSNTDSSPLGHLSGSHNPD